jgi:hypothetical protein
VCISLVKALSNIAVVQLLEQCLPSSDGLLRPARTLEIRYLPLQLLPVLMDKTKCRRIDILLTLVEINRLVEIIEIGLVLLARRTFSVACGDVSFAVAFVDLRDRKRSTPFGNSSG